MNQDKHLLAVFLDFENLAIGIRGRQKEFDIERVLARLVEKGTIVVKRAYADWGRFPTYARPMQETAFELLQIPTRRLSGKNSADMRLCVDVLDLCYSKSHIDTFVIISGDSDFSPLVSKLRENGKTVIGLGMVQSTSALLRDNCDEFIYYEDLETEVEEVLFKLPDLDEKEQELYTLLMESLQALRRENRDVLWASLIKETMKRKRPSFNEGYYGFKSFTALLESAADMGLLSLAHDPSRRTHSVTAFGDEVNDVKGAANTTTKKVTKQGSKRPPARGPSKSGSSRSAPRSTGRGSGSGRSDPHLDDHDDDLDDLPPRERNAPHRSDDDDFDDHDDLPPRSESRGPLHDDDVDDIDDPPPPSRSKRSRSSSRSRRPRRDDD